MANPINYTQNSGFPSVILDVQWIADSYVLSRQLLPPEYSMYVVFWRGRASIFSLQNVGYDI